MRDEAPGDEIRIALRLAILFLLRGLGLFLASGGGFLNRAREVSLREAKPAAGNFFDYAISLEFRENLGDRAAAAMMQAQLVGHFADALRMVDLGEVREKLWLVDFRLVRLLFGSHSVRRPFYWRRGVRERPRRSLGGARGIF